MSADADSGRGSLMRRMRRWQNAIGAASISRSEAALLNAYLPFIDVQTGSAFPSMTKLAFYSKMDERTVKTAWRGLVEKGVLSVLAESRGGIRSGRGIPHHVRLELDALEGLAGDRHAEQPPQTAGGSTPGGLRDNPRKPRSTTPANGAAATPTKRGGEPSIHTPPDKPPIGTIQPQAMAVQPVGGWMDGESIRLALQRAGVRGPNLEALANVPGLTLAEVREEWQSITRSNHVRNPAAVLYGRLAKRHGVTTGGRGPLDAGMMSAIGEVERLRRLRRAE